MERKTRKKNLHQRFLKYIVFPLIRIIRQTFKANVVLICSALSVFVSLQKHHSLLNLLTYLFIFKQVQGSASNNKTLEKNRRIAYYIRNEHNGLLIA